jgi:hypothetical protein
VLRIGIRKKNRKNLLQTHYKISPNPCKLLPKELPQIFQIASLIEEESGSWYQLDQLGTEFNGPVG